MSINYRKRIALGPVRINITQRGVASVALKLGPFTYNLKSRRLTTDLPGGLSDSRKV